MKGHTKKVQLKTTRPVPISRVRAGQLASSTPRHRQLRGAGGGALCSNNPLPPSSPPVPSKKKMLVFPAKAHQLSLPYAILMSGSRYKTLPRIMPPPQGAGDGKQSHLPPWSEPLVVLLSWSGRGGVGAVSLATAKG